MYKQDSPKYYIYNPDNGKRGKFVETVKSDEPKFVGPATDPIKMTFLRTNPFLYNPETALFPVLSIEEFLVNTGRQEIPFGDVIRNPDFTYGKRKKIIKKAFKTWNKDYNSQKDTAFIENDKTVEVIGEVSSLKFSLKSKLLLCFLFIFTVLVVGTNSYIWSRFTSSPIGSYFHRILLGMYESSTWLKVIGNLSVYIILVSIFYSFIYSLISRDFSRNYRLAQSYLDRSERTISRSYKKKWRKARKYYLKSISKTKNPYFPPLEIESVQEGEINIAVFKQICQVLVDRAYKYKKSKPFITGLKNVLMTLCIVGAGILFVFIIFNLILSIF